MRNQFIFGVLLFAPFMVQSMENNHRMEMVDTSEKMLDVTRRYLDFVNRLSQGEDFPQEEVAASILAPDCRKVFNATLEKESSADFIAELIEIQKAHGSWVVIPLEIIPAKNCVILRKMIELKSGDIFTAMEILRFNADNLISEINEVFNRVGNVITTDRPID